MEGREIGYNKHSGTNARQIVPVTEYSEIATGSELDILLYLNNYEIIPLGESCMKADMKPDDALDHFRKGARVAAGSTQKKVIGGKGKFNLKESFKQQAAIGDIDLSGKSKYSSQLILKLFKFKR